MSEIYFLNQIALDIAKIACGAVGVAMLLFIGWVAIQDYKERWK